MITTQTLIRLAPFQEEVKTELLNKVDGFSDGKKLELIDLCWEMIAQWYQEEIQHTYQNAIREMAEGEKEYTQEDLDKIPDDVLNEMLGNVQEASSQEDLQEVREKLSQLGAKTQ